MLEIVPNDRLLIKENIVLHQIPELGKYWAFNIEHGDQYSMNEISMFILQQLRISLKYEDLLHRVFDEYEVDEKQVQEDLKEILTQMMEQGIITRMNEGV